MKQGLVTDAVVVDDEASDDEQGDRTRARVAVRMCEDHEARVAHLNRGK